MSNLQLNIPSKTYDRLRSVALYQNQSVETFAKEILVLAERELWKNYGQEAKEMLEGLDYYNKHLR